MLVRWWLLMVCFVKWSTWSRRILEVSMSTFSIHWSQVHEFCVVPYFVKPFHPSCFRFLFWIPRSTFLAAYWWCMWQPRCANNGSTWPLLFWKERCSQNEEIQTVGPKLFQSLPELLMFDYLTLTLRLKNLPWFILLYMYLALNFDLILSFMWQLRNVRVNSEWRLVKAQRFCATVYANT